MGCGHVVGLESHRTVLQGFWSKVGQSLVVCSCSFLLAWLLDLQDTRDLVAVKEYSGVARKSPLDIRNVPRSRDVLSGETDENELAA